MPVSTSVHISHCLGQILTLNPRSVLDVGSGFGLWGFLCREYLDVMNERVQPDQWRVRIDGIELFEPYIQAHQRALYSSIQIGDIRELAPKVGCYDLIIAGDVIEHLEKQEGEDVLRCLYEKATVALMVNIPIGLGWDHPEQHGNPGELHRSVWEIEDFNVYVPQVALFDLPCGKYGSFLCMKSQSSMVRVERLYNAATQCDARGDLEGAVAHLRQAVATDPTQEAPVVLLTDILLRRGEVNEAIHVLETAVNAAPSFHYGRLAAAKIAFASKRYTAAREHVQALLAATNLPQEYVYQANQILEQIRTKCGFV